MIETITIRLTRKDAERISAGLADLLCWHQGYASGVARDQMRDTGDDPMGVREARDINIKLKSALNAKGEDR